MDRDTALMLGKCVIAGTIAWAVATNIFHASYATFAAFTAVLLMHQTIAESAEKALHYTAAVLVGIGLVGVVVQPWGPQLWILPLILLATLLIGRWRRLGSQGFNVTVAAIFAYGVFAMPQSGKSPVVLIPDLAGMVLLGAVVGVATNLIIAPPLRYRSAADAVDAQCGSVMRLLGDVSDGLDAGGFDLDDARDWRRRADDLPRLAAQTRDTVDYAHQTSKLNPRRLLVRDRSTFAGYRVTTQAVERISEQLRNVTAGLVRVADNEAKGWSTQNEFLRRYADVLTAVQAAVAKAAAIHTVDDLTDDEPLAAQSRHCHAALAELERYNERHGLDQPAQWTYYGGLFVDAQRLCEEVEWASDGLGDLARSLPRRYRDKP